MSGIRMAASLVLCLASVQAVAGEIEVGLEPARAAPNIVWIWADNLAYGDLGVYGNERVRTPGIDALAAQGVRFTQYYVAHTVCSPSRAAMLTGRQPFRVGIVDVLRPDGPMGIPADEWTLAEALRGRGYATAAIGKWHLGDRPEFLPTEHGFDSYFGIPYSMDMLPTVLYRDQEIVEDLVGDRVQSITERYTDEAIRFLELNRGRPFFLYFSHTLPHPPINLAERHRTPGRSIYEDAIEHLDSETGRLLEAMDRLQLSENTLVIFTSDNGPMGEGGNTAGLRGAIRDSYEGGVRVPMIARWPGRIPAGQVQPTPAIAYDMFPTLLALAGGELLDDRTYDGQDIWPLLCGRGEFIRRDPFVWVYLDQVTALREGRWKLHLARRSESLPTPELYDLDEDPGETKPVQESNTDVAARLARVAAEFQRQVPKVWSLQYPVRDPAKLKSGIRRR